MPDILDSFASARSLDPDTLRSAFGLRVYEWIDYATKGKTTCLSYPTPIGVDRIRFVGDEKPKYKWKRKGGRPHWYGWRQALRTLDEPNAVKVIYIVNGEPSVWACHQANVAAVCSCSGESALPDAGQCWELSDLGVKVRVVLDNDTAGRRGARTFVQKLRAFEMDVEARSWRDFFTESPDGIPIPKEGREGFDVDDLHRLVGDRLGTILADLSIVDVPDHDAKQPDYDSHYHLAGVVLERLDSKGPGVVYTQGQFFRYRRSGVWDVLDDDVILREAGQFDGQIVAWRGDKAIKLKVGGGVLGSIQKCAAVRVSDRAFFADAPKGVCFTNGFFDPDTLTLKPASPDNRQRVDLGVEYSPRAICPKWIGAMSDWFLGDEDASDKMRLLQEFAGAAILGLGPRFGKMLFLIGDGGDGKSQALDVFRGLVPDGFACAVSPQDMAAGFSSQYYIARLAGRRLNIVADIPSSEILHTNKFKQSVTGDVLSGRIPGGEVFEFIFDGVHMASANELPGTLDQSQGFWRRIHVMEFNRRFDESPNRILDFGQKILAEEKMGICAWAIKGARRLLAQGHYTVPVSSHARLRRWRTESDQVAAFLDDVTMPVDDADAPTWTGMAEISERYEGWAAKTRHGAMSDTKLGRRLAMLGYSDREGKKRRVKGRAEYRLRLRPYHSSGRGSDQTEAF